MTSERQILANRRNASRSTGPKTLQGKRRSRTNALKHGLTARSIVDVFECEEEFGQFARSIAKAYKISTPIDLELVHRLTALLWRLRRAHAVETGLISIQGKLQRDIRLKGAADETAQQEMFSLLGLETATVASGSADITWEKARTEAKARAFLRLCNLNGEALDRLSRYETTLWRQAVQAMLMLDNLKDLNRPALRLLG